MGKSRGLLSAGWSLGPSRVPVALRAHPSAPSFVGQLNWERHKPEEISTLFCFSDAGAAQSTGGIGWEIGSQEPAAGEMRGPCPGTPSPPLSPFDGSYHELI